MSEAISGRYDVVVVGGGPSGSTAAWDLARAGHSVLLIDREGRPKPCGGAVPPKLVEEFEIPDELIVARVHGARMISPSTKVVEMPIDNGYVGMVDREPFDAWLRQRARRAGARLQQGEFAKVSRAEDGELRVHLKNPDDDEQPGPVFAARFLIGADGARSQVAKQCVPGAHRIRYVAAYHEIIA
jgi:geranylgeranyl reductase